MKLETEEFIKFLYTEGWDKKWVENEERDKEFEDFEYERSYGDCIYDTLTIWKDEKKVNVSYNDIGWGYTNYENYSFTYEEFINWWKGIK